MSASRNLPVNAATIYALRERTGAGLHDSATMLRRAGGDVERAAEGLMKKGHAVVRPKQWFDDCDRKKPTDPKCFDPECKFCSDTEGAPMSESGGHIDEVVEVACNLCGLSCVLREGDHAEHGGLIRAYASGGYFSTPGNGGGALDDTTAYTFSLCEFCLDWLFTQFKIPVATTMYMEGDAPDEPWRPAAERVAADEWRKYKSEFTDEATRRAAARAGDKK